MSEDTAKNIYRNILSLTTDDENIRAVGMTGSRAQNDNPDPLADFDMQLYAITHTPYTESDAWISQLGEVWVMQKTGYDTGEFYIPTRLVIYEDGVKVDFAFYPLELLKVNYMTDKQFKLVLDKDHITEEMTMPMRMKPPSDVPTEAEYSAVVETFWFEAYHVAKYLARNDLWLVKFRDWATKEQMLPMLEWYAKSQNNWRYDTQFMGKHMQQWLDAETYEALHTCFGRFGEVDGWAALSNTVVLFRQLAQQVAASLDYRYPNHVDQKLSVFIEQLRRESLGA